ncbi:MAG: alcohol dehydrogenase catalytic domain-containing protein [Pirellulales bacterium]|nr:alcohol dehydrogenase catalytic domain-containing protein [Pirellulales bacterium]
MKAMLLERTGSLSENPSPLRMAEVPTPAPKQGELLIRVLVCGVCHTELDEIEGRLVPPHLPIIPGHEVVGRVVENRAADKRFHPGDRVGVGWIHDSDGSFNENLSPLFRATGFQANGGYAEFITVPALYAVPIPDRLSDCEAAPLMCAGAIGYRALKLSQLNDGEALGLMGFGGSGHLVLQTAKSLFPRSPVYVFARGESVQKFAIELGADWAGGVSDQPPSACRSIIDTTPAWRPVVQSLEHLSPGGRLVINAIRKEDRDKEALLELSYHQHLWMEREIKTVANLTHQDIAEFLPLAASIPLRPKVTTYRFEQANEALRDLRAGNIHGANVLTVSS